MKKIFIIIVFIICSIFGIGLIQLPRIIYSKLEYVSYSSQSTQSISSADDEIIIPNVMIVQLHLEYDKFNSNRESRLNYTLFEAKEYQKEFRNEARKYHEGNNKRIIESLSFGNYQELYVSPYSPFIDITYDYDYFMTHKNYILSTITKCKFVKGVSLIESFIEYEQCIDISCMISGAKTVYENRTKTGDGVVVGILENGVIDDDHADLSNTDITIRSSVYNLTNVSDHTTNMALIIAGANGVAPGASILNAYLSGTMNNEIDWMLQNGVDIINMSFVEDSNQGTYSSVSAYADYIAYTYHVILVAAAGNKGETTGYIGNPGLGYNVITVGSMSLSGERDDFSSYVVQSGPQKPTVSTAGNMVYLGEDNNTAVSGTSVSAALCSGFLALILEDRPSLAMDKGRLFALMSVSTTFSDYQIFNQENGFDNEVGAGMFHYQNIIDNYSLATNYTNSYGEADSIFHSRQIYLQAGQTLRASVALKANSDGTVNGISFTDYDVFVRNSNNEILAFANSYDSVVDMVSYTATTSGYYTVEIYQASDRVNSSDYLGFAYSII